MRYTLRIVIILAVAGLAVMLALSFLPRGYDTDLSRLGQGRPAAVLVHDPGLVASAELMYGLDRLRRDFEPDVQFMVADVNAPAGRAFAAEHSAGGGTLLLFDADGRSLARHAGGAQEFRLRALLETHYPVRQSRPGE